MNEYAWWFVYMWLGDGQVYRKERFTEVEDLQMMKLLNEVP